MIHLGVQTHRIKLNSSEKTSRSIYGSVDFQAPLPSDNLVKAQSGVHWENRASELALVLSTGVPVNAPVEEGHVWHIVDATWYRHWTTFMSSTR